MYYNYIMLLATLVVFFIPFFIIVKNVRTHKTRAKWISGIIYGIVAALLVITVISDDVMNYTDANIGLGLLFILVWNLTVVAFVVAVVLFIRKRTQPPL